MIGSKKLSVLAALGLLPLIGACAEPEASEAPADAAPVPAFTADANWPMEPADFEWGQAIGIGADSRGHVFTSSRSEIAEWDPQGNLVKKWSARGPNDNWQVIHGVFVDHNDFVWTNARESNLTLKFTKDGEHVLTIGQFDKNGGSNDVTTMGRPSEVWVDPTDNEVFIADGYGNRRIIVFNGETGEYLRHWGAYGEVPDDEYEHDPASGQPSRQFRTIHGITGSKDGLIYAADRGNNRVQVFRQNGEYVAEKIIRPACPPEDQPQIAGCGGSAAFSLGLSPDANQTYLYVADGGSHKIVVLRRSNLETVAEIGGPGTGVGEMGRPHNLTVDPQGNIFIAEAAGPWIKLPAGDSVQAGFRAQKFTFAGAPQP